MFVWLRAENGLGVYSLQVRISSLFLLVAGILKVANDIGVWDLVGTITRFHTEGSPFSECSASCGGGYQYAFRKVEVTPSSCPECAKALEGPNKKYQYLPTL